MESSMYAYVLGKVHPEIRAGPWSQIVIRALYARTGTAKISPTEKQDKMFNWQRPTMIPVDDTSLEVACFPGRDYVKHYAVVIGTYLSLTGHDTTSVQYSLPSERDCMASLMDSNLPLMGEVDTVLLGKVDGFDRVRQGSWESGNNKKHNIFAWQKFSTRNGGTASILGCKISFWGDISGYLVRALQALNRVTCILYIGKAGSLRAEYAPNEWLATGDRSHLNGRLILWNNVLEPYLEATSVVVKGTHTTVSSPLDETSSWYEKWNGVADWVDCEVGHMAQASNDGNTSFGYLHILSDNITHPYPYNLSNERLDIVVQNRKRLLRQLQRVVESFLER
ncbi:MAG: hypothetical protein Q9178_004705 [Gyalolechia marmorata]